MSEPHQTGAPPPPYNPSMAVSYAASNPEFAANQAPYAPVNTTPYYPPAQGYPMPQQAGPALQPGYHLVSQQPVQNTMQVQQQFNEDPPRNRSKYI